MDIPAEVKSKLSPKALIGMLIGIIVVFIIMKLFIQEKVEVDGTITRKFRLPKLTYPDKVSDYETEPEE